MTSQVPAGDLLVRGLAALDLSHLSDALDRVGIAGQCLGIRPLDRSFRLAGRAFTVRYVPVGTQRGTVGERDAPAGAPEGAGLVRDGKGTRCP